MAKFVLYYGPRSEFVKIIPERYYPLETLVKICDSSYVYRKVEFDHIVGYSMSYSSITEGGIQNFCTILDRVDDSLESVYLQNPPECISDEIMRTYAKADIEVRRFKYRSVGKRQLKHINMRFDEEIIGQPKVKKQLLASLYELYRKKNKNLPVIFMFYGPSGVGKTETAKYLSTLLGGDLFRQQLSMYQTQGFFDYLYGADHNRGSFAKDLLERKSNVVLLDEFDKAHPGIWSAFYQMFDEGHYMDKNYDVDLSNVIFICTSNEPSPEAIRKKIGDPLYYRVNRYIEFQSLDLAAKKKMVSKIVYEEYMSLRPEEKAKISLANLEERYLRGVEAFQNFRHARNLIRNDINQVLVEDFLIQSNESEEIVSKSKGV